jgi:putative ABC transport system permease protein
MASSSARTEESWGAVESDNHVVLPGYFRALGARVLKGRELSWEDVQQGRKVVVVDERLAARAFPGQDPIGRQLKVRSAGQERDTAEIVGVVEHVRQDHPGRDGREQTYVTLGLWPFGALYFAVRSPLPVARVVEIARQQLHQLDPELALYDVHTLRGYIAQVTATQRFAMQLLGIFAVLAAALAAIGLYGTIAYTVSQRDREFGIRMALGADRAAVIKMVMRESATLLALGLAVGAALAVAAGRAAGALFFGLTAADPATMVQGVTVLVVVAALATYVPAERAARIDPMRALREE